MHFTETNLSNLVANVFEQFLAQLHSAGCELDFEIEKDIFINCDAYRIEQVISNIVTNVLRYAPGKPVKVTLNKSDGRAILKIKDNGPGIAENMHMKIFERFERIASSSVITGLGLGLHICKQIVESHDGKVFVDSKPGHGSEFIVVLPLGTSRETLC